MVLLSGTLIINLIEHPSEAGVLFNNLEEKTHEKSNEHRADSANGGFCQRVNAVYLHPQDAGVAVSRISIRGDTDIHVARSIGLVYSKNP